MERYVNVLITRTDSGHRDPFFIELLKVIEKEISKDQYRISNIWFNRIFSDDKACEEADLKKIVNSMYSDTGKKHDVLIVIGKCNAAAAGLLGAKYSNMILVNRNPSGLPVDEVFCDGSRLAGTAVEYLADLGHRKIGYIGDCVNESRYEGFKSAMDRFGLEFDPGLVIETSQTRDGGVQAAKKFRELEDVPTAVYCANDITAIGFIDQLKKDRSVTLPSVISSDDIEEAAENDPPLTTVSVPVYEMGWYTAHLIIDRVNRRRSGISKMELDGKLMIRSTCHEMVNTGWNDYII